MQHEEIIHIDELVNICGFFTARTNVNNGYGCTHPKQEETDIDSETGKEHGKCYCFSCPLGHIADLQDMEKLDKDLHQEWENSEWSPEEAGAGYLVVDKKTIKNMNTKIYVLVRVWYDWHRFQENLGSSFEVETLKEIAKKHMIENRKPPLPILEYSPHDKIDNDLDDNETAHYWIQELTIN